MSADILHLGRASGRTSTNRTAEVGPVVCHNHGQSHWPIKLSCPSLVASHQIDRFGRTDVSWFEALCCYSLDRPGRRRPYRSTFTRPFRSASRSEALRPLNRFSTDIGCPRTRRELLAVAAIASPQLPSHSLTHHLALATALQRRCLLKFDHWISRRSRQPDSVDQQRGQQACIARLA